jgi:tRNA dimethylallyltransferase
MKKSKKNKDKILVILGPTATGKSDLAIKFAKKYNGEVISADSRQVYKGLNIGTGKVTKKEMLGVSHHMLDVVTPQKTFSVVVWKENSEKIISDIHARGRLPIICGGTGFYIQSIVDGIVLPEVPPNPTLRKKLEKKSAVELVSILKKLDPKRLKSIDIKNPVRLIRAIEIATKLGSVPTIKKQRPSYDILQIGITLHDEVLQKNIHNRLLSRMEKGMVKEAQALHTNGLSWKRMRELGLEYKYLADYLENKLTKVEFLQKLETEIWHYAKRQMTWFKRDTKIKWFNPKDMKNIEKEIHRLIK